MSNIKCRLFNVMSNETVCLVELPEELLDPKAGLIDPDTMRFLGVKYGQQFTLIPIDDPSVATLQRVREVYQRITAQPAPLLSAYLNRVDELIQAVGLLFGDMELYLCQSPEDFAMLINPRHNADGVYEMPPVIFHTILGDLLESAEEKVAAEEKSDEREI